MYTSGSTGKPKGVMIADGAWNLAFLGSRLTSAAKKTPAEVIFRGLAHANGSKSLYSLIIQGGQIALYHFEGERDTKYSGTTWSNLFTFLRLFRPTDISAVPQVWNAVYQEYTYRLQVAIEKNTLEQKKKIIMKDENKY